MALIDWIRSGLQNDSVKLLLSMPAGSEGDLEKSPNADMPQRGAADNSAADQSAGVADLSAFPDASGDVGPKLVSFSKLTSTSTVTYRLSFSEGVSGVGLGAFQLLQTSGSQGAFVQSVAAVACNPAVYDVVVSKGGGDGSFTLRLNAAEVRDASGAPVTSGRFLERNGYGAGVNPQSILISDVNGDGVPDLVIGNRGQNYGPWENAYISVLIGNGDGTFQARVQHAADAFSSGPSRVTSITADVDRDGRNDIVSIRTDTQFNVHGMMGIRLGDSDGAFRPVMEYSAGDGREAISVAVGDLSSDGRPDVVVSNQHYFYGTYLEGTVSVFLAAPPVHELATFQTASLRLNSFGASPSSGEWVSDDISPRRVADVNGDGRADIVAFGESGVYFSLGAANGKFDSPVLQLASFGLLPSAGGWASEDKYPRQLADVNGDGRSDIVGFGESGVYVAKSSDFSLI